MVLLGPGVIEVTRANRAKPSNRSSERVMAGISNGTVSQVMTLPHVLSQTHGQLGKTSSSTVLSSAAQTASWLARRSFAPGRRIPRFSAKDRATRLFSRDIPKLIDEIKAKAQPNYLTATCIITTAHKSKGLELDQVVLADDFPDLVVTKIKNNESITQLAEVGFDISAEEINLIYVAVTRAIKKLEINGSLNFFLSVID